MYSHRAQQQAGKIKISIIFLGFGRIFLKINFDAEEIAIKFFPWEIRTTKRVTYKIASLLERSKRR